MGNLFEIIVVTNKEQFVLEGLTELEAKDVLVSAYECINNQDEIVVFNDDLSVKALDLELFYIK